MPGKSYETTEATNGACFDDDLLYRHLEKMTTPEEEARIEQHLNTCNACFADIAALTEMMQTPVSEAEKIEIARTRKILPEAQVDAILKIVEDERAALEEKQPAPQAPMPNLDLAKRLIGIALIIWQKRRLAGLSLGFAFVTVFGLMAGIDYRRASSNIQQAERLLQENYRVFFDQTPRLAGGYESKGIGLLMGEDDSTSYLKQVSSLAEIALESGWKSNEAKQLLAKVFIINQDYDKADSVFKQISAESSAAILNDRGVLYFDKKLWETAAQYFDAAIKANPGFVEARYNLALVKVQMGAITDAITILNTYIDIEPNEGWRNAAMAFRDKLQQQHQ